MDNLASMLFHVESKNGVYLDRIVVGSMRQYPHSDPNSALLRVTKGIGE